MESLTIHEYATYEAFTEAHSQHGVSETEQPLVWALLTELRPEEVFLRLPRWLADEKVGYTDGGTPTTFVGQIDRSTDKAIHVIDSAAARPLMKRAHRIQQLEASLTDGSSPDHAAPADDQQRAWLERKLRDHRDTFADRTERVSLRDEWLPISQIETVIRATGRTNPS
jgi:hypothetical protein